MTDYLNYDKKGIPFPYNILDMLLAAVRETPIYSRKDENIDFTVNSVIEMIEDTLSPREKEIFYMRWRDCKTLDECGKAYNVTRERIRQIENKAIRKLIFAARGRCKYSVVSYADYVEMVNKYKVMKAEKTNFEMRLDKLLGIIGDNSEEKEEQPKAVNTYSVTIDNMNFSIRTYNCLKRAGKETLNDLLKFGNYNIMLKTVRNLGKKGADEIISAVHSYGLKMRWEWEENSV